ncbi:MAG: hypothetical protein JWL91_1271 [Sphingomonas bacterium]|nr:hypothetical protein [Sphingomonas bacterium]MDB5689395.1 hypothetical protein [Sphingomonas bacterium]
MKIIPVLALAATAFVSAAPAAAENYKFTREGVSYKVNETARDGVRTLQGRDSSGTYFTYRVRGSKVTGVYGRQPVSFDMPTLEADVREIASR